MSLRNLCLNYPRGLVSEIESIYNGVLLMEDPGFQLSRSLYPRSWTLKKVIQKASAADVFFRGPDYFVAGELHYHLDIWQFILEDFHKRDEILNYIKNGVSVFDFFKHFRSF